MGTKYCADNSGGGPLFRDRPAIPKLGPGPTHKIRAFRSRISNSKGSGSRSAIAVPFAWLDQEPSRTASIREHKDDFTRCIHVYMHTLSISTCLKSALLRDDRRSLTQMQVGKDDGHNLLGSPRSAAESRGAGQEWMKSGLEPSSSDDGVIDDG